MSIIEETLRNLQEEDVHQDIPGAQSERKKAPTEIKPVRSRKFVVISIYLTLFGLGAYYGLDRYQESINKKREKLNYNAGSLDLSTTHINVSPESITSHENRKADILSNVTQVTSVDDMRNEWPDQKKP
ncbi:Glycosyl transferase, family 2 [Candidatus Scalindua japonica]|uniref:Glycosyl transferase, family 2 n=1 Tax=Candidatus Scalindua japonica TaxID=1284222 RepID=A0A286U3K2_9BACT|nr:hypothetical protein [Candidatus Scalindua japonica]GAX62696.1 Glycosyl transferase, family 2 [Candidatus Scalindua japonica]